MIAVGERAVSSLLGGGSGGGVWEVPLAEAQAWDVDGRPKLVLPPCCCSLDQVTQFL